MHARDKPNWGKGEIARSKYLVWEGRMHELMKTVWMVVSYNCTHEFLLMLKDLIHLLL